MVYGERELWGIVNSEPDERADALRALSARVSIDRIIVAEDGPANSAAALLTSFLHVFRRDPTAQVVAILRNDRLIQSPSFGAILDRARAAAEGCDNRMVLLATPRDGVPASGLLPVAENDDSTVAAVFLTPEEDFGPLAPFRFASVLVANGSAFLRLYETAHPSLLRSLLSRERTETPNELTMSVDPDLLRRAPGAIKALVAASIAA